jgi:hypothetical protein
MDVTVDGVIVPLKDPGSTGTIVKILGIISAMTEAWCLYDDLDPAFLPLESLRPLRNLGILGAIVAVLNAQPP